MIQILFAFLAGVLTIAAPCILPMLPILLGASVGQQSKQRPLFIVFGFIISFSAASLLLSAFIQNLGLSQDILRNIAVVCLAIFALFMIWPKPFELLTLKLSGTINKAGQAGQGKGNWGGLILGLVLGIIWTPCAGPILASILVLIATQGSSAKSALLLLAYAIGAGLPMLIIAYGSQYITAKVRWFAQYSVRLQQIFGVLILLLAVAMYFQYDSKLVLDLSSAFPQSSLEESLVANGNPLAAKNSTSTSSTQPQIVVGGQTLTQEQMKIDFQNYGQAPDFTGIYKWLNSDPLTMAQLKGKVVLVDFWTYSCINCIRTLPYVTKWYDTYKDKGFVVIGVHTPEFAFEKVSDNVQTAIQRFGIHYPVAQDNDYGTWNAYNNQYWPAEYLINKDGEIVHEHFGEGEYDVTENAIRELLGLNDDLNAKTSDLGNIQSPEMYFEPSRLEYLDSSQQASTQPTTYQLPTSLALNTFALGGTWQFAGDHAELTKGGGKIQLHFSSGKVYMVASSAKPITLKITVDGVSQPDVSVQMSQLYTLFDSNQYKDHNIEIDIPDAGFQAFTFTFG
jgi:cytochrome c biogenesis protein CcdA/thiol-disulfide isomerase/thioredoxin